ncbi:unnamed protein product [Mytilus edulis]|uniref:Chitin-binding type-2 domain-containing protein n=1 Tax=Mytilus edulis TaxID=6550 RepID=A0A8S3S839_MYTED|nr:unnamed protein product [Mytilus edulis]
MESANTGEESIVMQDHYRNSHLRHVRNTANRPLYQKLDVNAIGVDFDHQYDCISQEPSDNNQPYHGYLQLPEFNKENIESDSHDYLKLHGSVKTNQRPGTELFTITTAITSTTEETISSSSKDQTTSFTIPPTQMSETVSSVLVPLFNRTAVTEEIQLNGQYEKPTLTLNADQVIDLIFLTNFYRVTGYHTCEGDVGYPTPSSLNIDIMYINGTSFQQIPDDHIYLNASRTFGVCRTMESLKFAIRFTDEMDGAKIRCNVAGLSDAYTSIENLTLIPNVDGTMFPRGIACSSGLCRNSLTGECSNNCSDAVCQEEVPKDFCTTPAPPTTTPIPTACQQAKPTLTLNADQVIDLIFPTNFYRDNGFHTCEGGVGYPTPSTLIIDIMYTNGTSFQQIPDDHIYRKASRTLGECQIMESLKFAIKFTEEMDGAKLRCSVANSSDDYTSIENLTLIPNFCTTPDPPTTTPIPSACNPGQPLITMHTDQIVDLGYYRVDRLHTCTGDVGVPSTHLIIELVYANGSEFQITGENIQSRQLQSGNCSNRETVKFGISFTSEMNGGKVRCSINGSSVNSTKNEIDLALIPRHPQSCYAYVLCEEIQGIIYPYGISCPSGECRNSITGICSANCSQAVCGETVPSGFCTTSAPMLPTVAPSQDIQCYGNSTFQFSGKVQMVCVLKQTDFTSMNVTFETTKQSNLIAQIASDRTVKMVDTRGKIYIKYLAKLSHHEETVTIVQNLTSEWNLTTITCQAVNQETITGEDDSIYYTSEESQIVLIDENYCSTREQYKSHPKSCYHYVWCTNDRMYQNQCAPPLCFFNATIPCSNCNEAPAPCTEP